MKEKERSNNRGIETSSCSTSWRDEYYYLKVEIEKLNHLMNLKEWKWRVKLEDLKKKWVVYDGLELWCHVSLVVKPQW